MKLLKRTCIILLIFLFLTPVLSTYADEDVSNSIPWEEDLSVKAENWPKKPKTTSKAAILIEASTGTILYEKKIHKQYYPASITKILTTAIALENGSLDDEVKFSHDSVYNIEPGSSHIGMTEGEKLTLEQCLYAVMLASANECSYAVAEHIGGGDYSKFIDMMNEKAASIGCKDSHFNNPHGLPDEDHYTTAYDMALIAKEAFSNEMFRTLMGTKQYKLPKTNLVKEKRTFQNHHKMLVGKQYGYEYCLGGKTGFTNAAGNTLVTYASKDGVDLICVLLKGNGRETYTDTETLFEYGFNNFEKINISDSIKENKIDYTDLIKEINTSSNSDASLIAAEENQYIILPKDASFQDAVPKITAQQVEEDSPGTLIYTYEGRYVGHSALLAQNTDGEGTIIGEIELENTKKEKKETKSTPDKPQVKIGRKPLVAVFIIICLLIIGQIISKKLYSKGKRG